MINKGYGGVVQFDADGNIAASSTFDKILDDSIHSDTFGGLGKGAGEAALYQTMKYSRDVAGRDGFVTFFSASDSIGWYLRYGFDTKPGQPNGRILMNTPEHVKKFMKRYEDKKL